MPDRDMHSIMLTVALTAAAFGVAVGLIIGYGMGRGSYGFGQVVKAGVEHGQEQNPQSR